MAEQADKHGIPSAVVRLPGSRAIRSAFFAAEILPNAGDLFRFHSKKGRLKAREGISDGLLPFCLFEGGRLKEGRCCIALSDGLLPTD